MPAKYSQVRVFPKGDVPEESFREVDSISFIDNESHGPIRTFGLVESFKGKALIIASPSITAVEVTKR